MVIWLIGMSGAGKTCIGRELFALLKARRPNVVFLDGDHIREIMGNDLGHTIKDRRVNAERISHLCQFLSGQGIDVVCAILSIFTDMQTWNRQNIPQYFEVYIQVPFKALVTRDTKGLYRRALAGECRDVVGVDIEFPPPPHPDVVIDNGPFDQPPQKIARDILARIPWEKS